ncbi:hypothetical protein ACH5RR_035280 [Cinchona calisaya]|uniref:Syringolide-induced protein 14-1-1 n=1 Tax=Cinchona calisaya TaxID=153742 RepID=A0ABD2YDD8_9GENT
MEKLARAKSKLKLLIFLRKAASTVKLLNHPFSPGNKVTANRLKSHQNKGFSGPFTSIIFEEPKSFDAKEPTSPKISCMGQIKHKKKISKNKNSISLAKEAEPFLSFPEYSRNKPSKIQEKKKKSSISREKEKPRRKSDASAEMSINRLPDRAPSLSQMKRFASGRDPFSKFDWTTAQVVPAEDRDNRRYCYYYSDEEKRESEDEEDDEVIIPFSAPLLLGEVEPVALPLEPRKEINLWKRRTMVQPKPLQL